MSKIFAIFDKEHREFVCCNDKPAWCKKVTAVKAFNKNHSEKYDDQSRYVILELTEDWFNNNDWHK